jgi:hypothetical protein
MSNVATRTRRTVPLNELDDSRESISRISDDDKRRTSSLSANEHGEHYAPPHITPVKSEPQKLQQRSSMTSSYPLSMGAEETSSHSRGSYKSSASSAGGSLSHSNGDRSRKSRSVRSTSASHSSMSSSDGHRGESIRRGTSRTTSMSGKTVPRTPSSGSERMTIGHSSGLGSSRTFFPPTTHQRGSTDPSSDPPSSVIPDLFVLERAFSEYGQGADVDGGIDRYMRNQKEQHRPLELPSAAPQRRDSNHTEGTPVTWKTPFEVDAPRDTPVSKSLSHRPSSPAFSTASEPSVDPRLSEEQDAWAGIDALLETRSCDDSCAFSMSDILPSSTVKAMRKDGSFRSMDISVMNDDDMSEVSDGLAVLTLKNQRKGHKKGRKFESGMPSLVEAPDQDEDSISKAAADSSGRHQSHGVLTGGGAGNLFEVFHWSEKDNVDETKGRKKKLNQTRRVRLVSHHSSQEAADDTSDTASLPSLNSFRDDDLPARSETNDWHSTHDNGSVITEDFHTMTHPEVRRGRLQEKTTATVFHELATAHIKPATPSMSTSSLRGDGLVLDKQVDEYINRIQKQLPTISEDTSRSRAGRNRSITAFLVEENSPSPTSVVPDDSPLEELPSLASFATPSSSINPSVVQCSARKNRRKEEKREPKRSLSTQLISSIKRIGSKTGTTGGGIAGAIGGTNKPGGRESVVNGDEEKYFPDTEKQDKSKLFSANRCLLNSGDDGVNWDAT